MSPYVIVIEQGETSFGASVPDLPGCVAVGKSLEEVLERIAGSIKLHLKGMREDGLAIPGSRPNIATVAAAIFRSSESNKPADYVAPITENSPGVKLRRAEELYKRATSR